MARLEAAPRPRSTPARRITALLLAVILCGFPSGVGHAFDVPATAGTGISPSRFPSLQAVARIFPDYRGGRRELLRGRQFSVTSGDCLNLELAATQPRAGMTAIYANRRGESPFVTGGTNAVVAVYDFRRPKRAQAALDEQRDVIESCYGRHDDDGFGATLSPLDAPSLAQDEFSYRLVSRDRNTGRDWFIFTYLRERRFLVLNFLQRDRSAPAARRAFRLARASVRAVS